MRRTRLLPLQLGGGLPPALAARAGSAGRVAAVGRGAAGRLETARGETALRSRPGPGREAALRGKGEYHPRPRSGGVFYPRESRNWRVGKEEGRA